jgi:hypothetical protein
VIRGIDLRIPILVLIRDPADAVISLMIREPHLSLRLGLRTYLDFHQAILRYREDFTLATFEAVTTDFGSIMREVNASSQSSFEVFRHNQENVQRCFSMIEARNRSVYGGEISESTIARPSAARQARKEALGAQLEGVEFREELAKCRAVYQKLTEESDHGSAPRGHA